MDIKRFGKALAISTVFAISISACGGGGGGDSGNDDSGNSNVQTQSAFYADITVEIDRVVSADDQRAITDNLSKFPRAEVVPPLITNGALPGWFDIGIDDFSRYVYASQANPLITDPHFFQFVEQPEDHGNDFATLLQYVATETGLTATSLDDFVKVEAWFQVFGVELRVGFGSTTIDGAAIDWFMDVLGIREDGTVLVNVVYARSSVFDTWDGILLPLVLNGYVSEPSLFDNRDVFQAGTDEQKTQFYSAMVNTKVISDFGAFVDISAGAQQAMDNAVTISQCAGASNCTITYVGGVAFADYD